MRMTARKKILLLRLRGRPCPENLARPAIRNLMKASTVIPPHLQ
jgi:hypothetical protein